MAALGVQDEISTGLDTVTTFQIINYLRDLTHTQLNTTLISLLQPAPESFQLFDDVMLIAEDLLPDVSILLPPRQLDLLP